AGTEHLPGGRLKGLEELGVLLAHATSTISARGERLVPGEVNQHVDWVGVEEPCPIDQFRGIDAVSAEGVEDILSSNTSRPLGAELRRVGIQRPNRLSHEVAVLDQPQAMCRGVE